MFLLLLVVAHQRTQRVEAQSSYLWRKMANLGVGEAVRRANVNVGQGCGDSDNVKVQQLVGKEKGDMVW